MILFAFPIDALAPKCKMFRWLRSRSFLEALHGSIGHCISLHLNFIWTFSAKRLQIERLELGIWYDLGISKEFMKSLCRPFAVKESAEKHLIERLVVEGFLDHSRQAYEQAIAFAAVGRSVHDGQSFRPEIGQ